MSPASSLLSIGFSPCINFTLPKLAKRDLSPNKVMDQFKTIQTKNSIKEEENEPKDGQRDDDDIWCAWEKWIENETNTQPTFDKSDMIEPLDLNSETPNRDTCDASDSFFHNQPINPKKEKKNEEPAGGEINHSLQIQGDVAASVYEWGDRDQALDALKRQNTDFGENMTTNERMRDGLDDSHHLFRHTIELDPPLSTSDPFPLNRPRLAPLVNNNNNNNKVWINIDIVLL